MKKTIRDCVLIRSCLFFLSLTIAAAETDWPPLTSMPSLPGISSPTHPDFPGLPDPLRFFNFVEGTTEGEPVSNPAVWQEQRRLEILDMARHYMYGHEPPAPAVIHFSVLSVEDGVFNGLGSKKIIHGTYGPTGTSAVRIALYMPATDERRVPVIAALNKAGNEEIEPGGSRSHRWDVEGALASGVALATAFVDDFATDGREYRKALIDPYAAAGFDGDWRTISAWAWGLSRIIDYLVTDPGIDPHRIAVTGFSRRGKAALWAGALDDRIALTIPHQSGHGGAHSSRPVWGGYYSGYQYPHWFLPEYNDAGAQEITKLPFDQHCIIAAIAPRRVLLSENEPYGDGYSGLLAIQAGARPVWSFLGADPTTGVVLKWDTTAIHRHEPYHWADAYNAVNALPRGGMDGFRLWAVEQGHIPEEADEHETRAAMSRKLPAGATLLEHYYFDLSASTHGRDTRLRVSAADPNPCLSLPYRPESSGIPARGNHWRGIEQWLESSTGLDDPWIPSAVDDLDLLEASTAADGDLSRLALEDRRTEIGNRTFYRLHYRVRGEDGFPVVIQHPRDGTVTEGERITFMAHISGGPLTYLQWQKNGVDIPGAHNSFLTLSSVGNSDTGFYRLAFGDGEEDRFTREAQLNVLPDTTAPHIEHAEILADTQLLVRFNTTVEAGTGPMGAENPINYGISPFAAVEQATLLPDQQTVLLQVEPLLLGQQVTLTIYPVNSAADDPVAGSEQIRVLAHTIVARINFQPAGSIPPPGWLVDSGEAFGPRGSGFAYGWTGPTGSARARDNAVSPSVLYDTLIHAGIAEYSDDPDWKIALPDGPYLLRLVAGDPTYVDNTFSILANGASIISGSTSSNRRWIEGLATITVEDGHLVLSQGPGARRNKPCFLEIHLAP